MSNFQVITGGGLNPRFKDSLPSILHFDLPTSPEELVAQDREIEEHDLWLRGFRGVVSNDTEEISVFDYSIEDFIA